MIDCVGGAALTAEEARSWCVEALAALAAGGNPDPWADGLARAAAAGEVGLVRPALARALAERAHHPAVLPALAAYVRSAPAAEALEFATDWAKDAWEAFCAAPRDGDADLAAAMALAGLTIAHAMDVAAGPPFDKDPYNVSVEAARHLFEALARSAPTEPTAPPSLLSNLLARAETPDLGFPPAVTLRIPSLVRICKDFGRSLPRRNPGLPYLA